MKAFKAALLSACVMLGACTSAGSIDLRADDEPALFVVRDADSTMYLYGTVHVRRAGSAWGGPSSEAALNAAEEVWTEVEMTDATQAQAQMLMLQRGMAPADRPLSSWLSEEENARLNAALERLNLPAGSLERMQPWLAALTLAVLPMIQAGYDPEQGVDRSIDAIADAAGKNRRALETIEQQIGFLSGFSDDVQRQMLLDSIDGDGEAPEQMDALSAAWEQGDLRTLEAFVIDDMRAHYPELYQVMFPQRNNAWMETLTQEMDGAGVDFVAVGAGHLLGRDGLVAQFRARGYEVERVRAE